MDLFELKGHGYLLVIDYYSRWRERSHLQTTISGSIVDNCKSIFVRYGIREAVISDNDPQFFLRLTSSPHYPQGNEKLNVQFRQLKPFQNKKASDPYIALLNYHSIPPQHGKGPAELLMKRKLKAPMAQLFIKMYPAKKMLSNTKMQTHSSN
ncbi:uncharacterized protein LOC115227445 [Octopus sinensis]|uniref:Uncharacterized protein LOC115227445 n=1 Tax=Octopus sinensis TaxID=2607531 RepID=A0A6P7TPK5_9MOLL|nr:uncharacterized protein LOC115227445 [Octopus sinensis]